jgi:hypothetical protein
MDFRVHLARTACAILMVVSACARQKSAQVGPAPQASAAPPKMSRPVVAGPTNPALRLLRSEETTPEIAQRAREILDANRDAPFGTEVPLEIDGRSYVGRIEEHYHEPGGPRRPWGRHRGITVYRAD